MISIVQRSPTTDRVRAIEQVMVSICCQRMLGSCPALDSILGSKIEVCQDSIPNWK